jgi:hypothetical protein
LPHTRTRTRQVIDNKIDSQIPKLQQSETLLQDVALNSIVSVVLRRRLAEPSRIGESGTWNWNRGIGRGLVRLLLYYSAYLLAWIPGLPDSCNIMADFSTLRLCQYSSHDLNIMQQYPSHVTVPDTLLPVRCFGWIVRRACEVCGYTSTGTSP